MSTVVSKNVQIGADGTASNNFTAYQPATPDGTLRIGNGNSGSVTDAITLTSAGNVGIGTSAPATPIHVYNASPVLRLQDTVDGVAAAGSIQFWDSNSQMATIGYLSGSNNDFDIFQAENAAIDFYTNATQRMRISSAGNVGIGTSTTNQRLNVFGPSVVQVLHNTDATSNDSHAAKITTFDSGAAHWNYLNFEASSFRFSGYGTERVRITGDGNVGIGKAPTDKALELYASAGTAIRIQNSTTGTGGGDGFLIEQSGADSLLVNYEVGNLKLYTSGSERARIDSSGVLMVNTTTRLLNSFLSVYNATDNSFMARVGDNTKATIGGLNASSALTFYVAGSGQVYSTSTSITAISDRSQKENIKEITYGLSTVQNLKPVQFDFKAGCGSEEKGLLGFIAQDVEQVIPELVKTNNDDLKTLKMGDMLPVLVKAIQEQQAIIESLTARISALEGN